MAGFADKLAGIKAAQEAQQKAQKEAVTAATNLERSEKVGEREAAGAEFAETEKTAEEASDAIAQADAYLAEAGDGLDAETKAAVDSLKTEASGAQQKFTELKDRLGAINSQLANLAEDGLPIQGSAEAGQLADEEKSDIASVAEKPESEKSVEVKQQTPEQIREEHPEYSQKTEVIPQNETGETSANKLAHAEKQSGIESKPIKIENGEDFSEKSKYFYRLAAQQFAETNLWDAGYLYEASGDKEKSMEAFMQCSIQTEASGDAKLAKGDYGGASQEFQSAAKTYLEAGDQSNYERMMNKAAEIAELNAVNGAISGFVRAAEMYEKVGNPDKAKEMHMKAAQDAERWDNSDFYAALEYEKAGDQEKAKVRFQQTIQKFEAKPEPGRPELRKIAESYSKLGNSEKAREVYLRLADEEYKSNGFEEAVVLYRSIGNDAKAREIAEEYVQQLLGYSGSSSFGLISKVYRSAGNIEKAEEYNQLAIDSDVRHSNDQGLREESFGTTFQATRNFSNAGNKVKMQDVARRVVKRTENMTEQQKQNLSRYDLREIAGAYGTLAEQ